jgi:predicted tellurium resistance membrane protein TerC
MELFSDFASLLALIFLEIILGIDNVIFIAIVADRLPENLRERARIVGLSIAVGTRLLLLLMLSAFVGMTNPLFNLGSHPVSVKDLVMFFGGAFLIYKATKEIHNYVRATDEHHKVGNHATFTSVIFQILIVDLVFSLDSVITAVGVGTSLWVMSTAVIISIIVMLLFSKVIVQFITENPTLKMLALAFILAIGLLLLVEGTGKHVDKAYIYAAMGFSLLVEMGNMYRERSRRK